MPQTVHLVGVADDAPDGDRRVGVTFDTRGAADAVYAGLAPVRLEVVKHNIWRPVVTRVVPENVALLGEPLVLSGAQFPLASGWRVWIGDAEANASSIRAFVSAPGAALPPGGAGVVGDRLGLSRG